MMYHKFPNGCSIGLYIKELKPIARLVIRKFVNGHKETLRYEYEDILEASNDFCSIVKDQADFYSIEVEYGTDGLNFFDITEIIPIRIKGNQYIEPGDAVDYISGVFSEYTTVEEALVQIKMKAIELIRNVKCKNLEIEEMIRKYEFKEKE